MSETLPPRILRSPALSMRGSNPRRGAILVGVLWIMVFIGFLAVVLRLHMTSVVTNVRVTEDKAAARMLADAGLAYGAAMVRAGGAEGAGELSETFSGVLETGSGTVSVTLENEATRIDLNTALRPLIMGAFKAAGSSESEAAELADEIVERRGGEEAQPREGENAPPPPPGPGQPGPRQGPGFRSVDELALLPDMEEDVAVAVARYATVSSGLPGMRLISAELDLLEDIPGFPRSALEAVKRYRDGRLDVVEVEQMLSGLEYNTVELAQSWRAGLRVELSSGHAESYEAIIAVPLDDDSAYRVLDWRRVTDEIE